MPILLQAFKERSKGRESVLKTTPDRNGTDECKVYSQAGFTATIAWGDGGVWLRLARRVVQRCGEKARDLDDSMSTRSFSSD